ncbi:hypothetical protein AAF712_012476 [Marasmius tenuissimus]|uniref:Uncharacterized protein n=1 Tax=Marasmius tenuissimus TaxID=585030 RepID=A0ABR2ZIE3_9AGAR
MARLKQIGKKKLLAAGHEPLPKTDLNDRFHTLMGTEHRFLLSFFNWVDKGDNGEFEEDVATRDFVPKLKDHLLHQILGPESKTEYTIDEHSKLNFTNDAIFAHKTVQFNYNTYNRQREQDFINSHLHPDIYTLLPDAVSNDSQHPYQYAQKVPITKHIKFLWVCWYQVDMSNRASFHAKHLYWLFFPAPEDDNAFGFINPTDVICGAHIIPAYHHSPLETGTRLPPTSLARQLMSFNSSRRRELKEDDWKFYHVGMFADCDTVMSFCGGGVRHPQFHEYLCFFEKNAGLDAQVLPRYNSNREEITSTINNEGDKEEEIDNEAAEHSNEDEVDGGMDEDEDMEHAML